MSLQPMPAISPSDRSLFDFADTTTSTEHSEAYSPTLATAAPLVAEVLSAAPSPQAARVLEDRWYQTNALADIAKRLPYGRNRLKQKGELLVCPTGGGKTSIASRAIKRWLKDGKRVLILVDLDRLLEQMREDLAEEGIYPLIEKAQHSALSQFGRYGNCVLASMQTLYAARLNRWDKNAFDFIVVDEAHDVRFLPITEYFASAQLLGLTATPREESKKYFNFPFINTLTLRQAIEGWNDNTKSYEKPFLSRIAVLPIDASHIDLGNIKLVKKDFEQRELDKKIFEHVNWLASAIIEVTDGRRPWIFCPKIPTADALAKALRDLGASYLSYHSKTENPARVYKKFLRDEVQGLTNVNMLIKGVNAPKVDCIIRVRPSLNTVQATQEIGRGTRLSPQTGKKNCLVVEFAFDTGGRRLMGALDAILDGQLDKERATKAELATEEKVRERAQQIVEEGTNLKLEIDVIRAFDRARKQVSEAEAEARRLKAEAKFARHERVDIGINVEKEKYDPFAGLAKAGATPSAARESRPATPQQMAELERLSKGKIQVKDARMWTEDAAVKRIEELEIRHKYKLATEPQLCLMVNTLGFDAKKAARMKWWDASTAIDNRVSEMALELEQHPECHHDYEGLKAMKVWQLANLHKSLCRNQGGEAK